MASEPTRPARSSRFEPGGPPRRTGTGRSEAGELPRRDSGRLEPEERPGQLPERPYPRDREGVRFAGETIYRHVPPRRQEDLDRAPPEVEGPRDYDRAVPRPQYAEALPPSWPYYLGRPDLVVEPSRDRDLRRLRSRRREDSEAESDGSSVEGTDEIDTTEFEFKLSRVSQSESQKTRDFSDDETPSQAEKPPAAVAWLDPNVLRVYQSRYTGDAYPGGQHSVTLVGSRSEPPAGVGGEKKEPLFRWLHISQDIMSFDQLSGKVTSIPWLTRTERNGLAKLLGEVKKNCVKTKQRRDGKHVKYMEPRFIQVPLKPERRSGSRWVRTVSWLSIPYFSLQQYSGGLLSATDPASFPPLTLLQAQYSRIEPRRDTEFQVVRRLGDAAGNSCFHIAQLWCIVVDNSLLVTCGTMTEDDLQRNVITVKSPEPPMTNGKAGSGLGTIFVSYSEAVLWSFPLHECMTWPTFVSHFYDFWPEAIQFSHEDKILSADNWKQIISLAGSGHKVVLRLRLAPRPKQPLQGNLKVVKREDVDTKKGQDGLVGSQQATPRGSSARPPRNSREPSRKGSREDQFRVFSWVNRPVDPAANTPEDPGPDDAISRTLSEIEDYLLKETKYIDKLAYQGCKEANRLELFEYLRQQGSKIAAASNSNRDRKLQYERRVDILNAADTTFQFFLPVGQTGIPTESKYWGAIRALIEMPPDNAEYNEDEDLAATWEHVPTMRARLREAASAQQHIQDLMTSIQPSDRAKLVISDDWCNAWIHTLAGVIYATQDTDVWEEHLAKADRLRDSGWEAIMKTLQSDDDNLLDRVAIQPMDIISLVGLRLLHDSVSGAPHDISETYSEYLDSLEVEISAKAPDRSFQHWVGFLQQELAVIQRTVEAQRKAFEAIVSARWQSQPERAGNSYKERVGGQPWYGYEPLEVSRRANRLASDALQGTYGSAVEVTRTRPRYYETVPRVDYDAKPSERHHYSRRDYHGGAGMATSVLNPEEAYKLSPTHPGGFRDLFAAECQAFLDRRLMDVSEYGERAAELKQTNALDLEQNKDRQETALYAFTIVTIIFLPLSAVAGIFGMNTADIRDMDHGQWLYWATGVPVTAVVIAAGLWWTGDLRSILAWLMGRQPGGGGGGRGRPAEAASPPGRRRGAREESRDYY